MALTANATMTRVDGTDKAAFKVAGSTHIYTGALVGKNPAGHIKAFVLGDEFLGVSNDEFNQTGTTGGAVSVAGDISVAGVLYCNVWVGGEIVMACSGAGVDDIGKAVYASADDAIALTGNADAFVGRIIALEPSVSNGVRVRLKRPGEKTLPTDLGSLRQYENATGGFTATGATAGTTYLASGFAVSSALGLGVTYNSGASPQVEGEFDAVAEIAHANIYGLNSAPVSGGLRLRGRWVASDSADSNTMDLDFGLGTILTANSIADMSHADMVDKIAFHMDGGSNNILGWSEATNTEVTPVDTTIDNDATTDTYKDFMVIVRPSGACELWIDSGSGFVQVLDGTTGAATTLTVGTSVSLAPFLNMEKTSNDTTAVWLLREIEFTGARTTTIG